MLTREKVAVVVRRLHGHSALPDEGLGQDRSDVRVLVFLLEDDIAIIELRLGQALAPRGHLPQWRVRDDER